MPGAWICARSVVSAESDGLVTATTDGLRAAGEVPPEPSAPAERLSWWCGRWPSPAPEMLRRRAAQGEQFMDAAALGKKPDRRRLEFPGSPSCATWPDRNRRSTLPNQDTLSRVNCLPHRSAQASKCRTLLVAYHKEQERYRKQ
jgi:hypothetical protein